MGKGKEKMPFRQLAICGTAETLKDAPFDDETYDIWATGTCLGHPEFKRADALFELHPRDRWIKRADALNESKAAIFMKKKEPEISRSVVYPIDDVLEMFPRKYFTNTISYMLALGILEDIYSVISLYGVHLATENEYTYERPNLEYYIGQAEGRGIKVEIPQEAEIMKCSWMYGYEHSDALMIAKGKRNEIKAKASQLEHKINELTAGYHEHKGAQTVLDYMIRVLRK